MAKRILDYNPITGETVNFDYDHAQDKIHITHEQNVNHLLDGNKRLQNSDDYTRKGMKKDMLHYASIPNTLIIKWKNELGIDVFSKEHRSRLFKLLNSPEYRYLKTTNLKHEE